MKTTKEKLPQPGVWEAHPMTFKKLEVNYRRNKRDNASPQIDLESGRFCYSDCADSYWNPEEYSLLYGTPLWEQADASQRVTLNQLYWVAYYSQIISAEIATIHFNQTSATALYGIEDFRLVCDTLDLESAQERSHIAAFRRIGDATEEALLGGRLFLYPMRTPFTETMVHTSGSKLKRAWKRFQLQAFSLLSANNAFLACQYFTVRGLRTLNGKMVQHELSRFYSRDANPESMPIPSRISHLHFLDESHHFHSSTVISQEILKCLPQPTRFERWIGNLGILGCQRDHFHFCTSVRGIFWYDPATFPTMYRLLRSRIFRMDHNEAIEMLEHCYGKETEAMHRSAELHALARRSYIEYIAGLDYVGRFNRDMKLMAKNSPRRHLIQNRQALRSFRARLDANRSPIRGALPK